MWYYVSGYLCLYVYFILFILFFQKKDFKNFFCNATNTMLIGMLDKLPRHK